MTSEPRKDGDCTEPICYPKLPHKSIRLYGMLIVIIGGIMAMAAPFVFYMGFGGEDTSFMSFWDFIRSAEFRETEFLYLWLMPVGGMLAIAFAAMALAARKSLAGMLAAISGLMLIAVPLAFALHVSSKVEGTSFFDVFYESNESQTVMLLGGILAIMGGLMAAIGGFMLARSFKKTELSDGFNECGNGHSVS